jgi:PAS domain S-box-containing protein
MVYDSGVSKTNDGGRSTKATDDLVRERAQEHSARGTAVIATEPAGRILFWDEGAESLYGWSAGEVLGRNIVDVTPASQSQAEAAHIMKVLRSGETWSGSFEVQDREGNRFRVHVTDTPVFLKHGKLVGIIGVSRRESPKKSGGT